MTRTPNRIEFYTNGFKWGEMVKVIYVCVQGMEIRGLQSPPILFFASVGNKE